MNAFNRTLPALLLGIAACSCSVNGNENISNISEETVREAIGMAIRAGAAEGPDSMNMLPEGVEQVAGLWREEDGSPEEFKTFVAENYAAGDDARKALFDKLSAMLELTGGSFYDIYTELQKPVQLDWGPVSNIDAILASYDSGAHFTDDMFANKVAFITVLNFPHFTLDEKNALGKKWSRLEWAYARMGDVFTSRIPARIQQMNAEAMVAADSYIGSYNIKMGRLLTEDGRRLFPEGMSLLSHWNLRDELKSNYADVPDANEKQEMIYKVMERIILQDIPEAVIDNDAYDWKPYSNETFKDGKKVDLDREPDTRYENILRTFHACLAEDEYCPAMPTGIQRNFDGGMEVTSDEIESLFISLLEAPQVKEVAELIGSRLGRELRPYDIWYDGFKSRSSMPEDKLSEQTRAMYPDCEAFHNDIPRLLQNLGFTSDEAAFIADHVVVEPARGSGHAHPCVSRTQPARLRTRVGADGMDYKGYNISVHEFGHNTEEVLSLYHMDHYMLAGIPNTAFTEAMAFLFQCRDLQLLGYGKQEPDENFVLDHFWGAYEIMGVSLVDMYMWRWLYANKDATAAQLREQTVAIAKDVWNKYYEPVLGTHDSPILAVYSHMVNSPMYLPNYPFGHLVHFQVEQHLAQYATKEEFAEELIRIYTLGRLTPKEWMRQAIGSEISTKPMLDAVESVISKEGR